MDDDNKRKRRRRSRRWKNRQRKRMPINVAASFITTISLYCGIASIFASIRLEYEIAAYWILGSMIFDSLDGTVARLTNSVSDFGKELDSLADVIAFGVAPAVLMYNAYLLEGQETGSELSPIAGLVTIVYVIFGALRLARYNVFQADRQDLFIGLPIPGAAGTIASFVLFTHYFDLQVAFWVMSPVVVTLAFLMVSTVRYPKKSMSVFVLAPRKGFQLLVLFVVGLAVFHYALEYSPSIVLFPLAVTYVLFGVTNETVTFLTRRRHLEDGDPLSNETSSPGELR